ncbi:MAG: DUF4623 domain-containing protein [Paludibacter sp.]|jgi:hypothetical protein|nr:DUF4623 domain-containing protein [Paludibacter sp.]
MRKITFLIAVTAIAVQALAVEPTWTRVWEMSATLSTNPAYIGTSNNVRGMAVGTFENEKVVVIPTREGGNAVKLLLAADGTEWKNLNVTGIAGGTFAISDAGVTTDGKILVANMVNAAAAVFKVYRWDNSTDAPTVAISYTLDAAHRIGDHITVKGSTADGTAKVYAMSTALVATKATLFRFDMVSDGNGGYVFSNTPTVITNQISATGGYNSVDMLPDNAYLYKYNGSQIMKLNSDGTSAGQSSSSAIVATGGNSVRYLLTKDAVNPSDPDTVYVAYFRYGSGQERANIVKFPGGTLNDAGTAIATYLPALGTNANSNGAGRVAIDDVTANSLNLYVMSTNNGIGKYSISWPDITTSVKPATSEMAITLNGSVLRVEYDKVVSIELFNIMGQKVKSITQSNELSVEGLSGVHIVKVQAEGQATSTRKLNIR